MEVCSVCKTPRCAECLSVSIDGAPACASCGVEAEERGRSLGSAILALVGAGYLVTLAIGYLVFHARPFVGGVAAIVAIALGRSLTVHLHPPIVRSRPR